MSAAGKFPAPGTFDPAAWVAEFEALGGRVHVIDRGEDGLWIGRTIPRRGIANSLLAQTANDANHQAVADYIAARDGVMIVTGRGA